MTRFLILLMLLLNTLTVPAQTWEEWTQQDRTRIKRLVEQIAGLRVYNNRLVKDYSSKGGRLSVIGESKKGDYVLHRLKLDSLRIVKPAIQHSFKLKDIIATTVKIINGVKNIRASLSGFGQFNSSELNHYRSVMDNFLVSCRESIEMLSVYINPQSLLLSDDERISQIGRLWEDVKSKHAFLLSFSNEINLLAIQRMTEQTEINYSKRINGFAY